MKTEFIKNLEKKILRLLYPRCKTDIDMYNANLQEESSRQKPITLERVLIAFEKRFKEGHNYGVLSDKKKLYEISTKGMKYEDLRNWIIDRWIFDDHLENPLEGQSQPLLEILDQLLIIGIISEKENSTTRFECTHGEIVAQKKPKTEGDFYEDHQQLESKKDSRGLSWGDLMVVVGECDFKKGTIVKIVEFSNISFKVICSDGKYSSEIFVKDLADLPIDIPDLPF